MNTFLKEIDCSERAVRCLIEAMESKGNKLGRHRLLTVCAALLPLLAANVARGEKGVAWLEIPALQLHLEANQAAVLKADRIPFLLIHLNRQTDEVAYARVNTRVNAETANIVTTQRTMEDGIVCNVDLLQNPMLALHAGRNSVEVSYKDRWNSVHYSSFILQLPGEKPRAAQRAAGHAGPPYAGPQRYALVIGVARYKYAGRGVQNLPYADADAAAFHDFMLLPHGGNIAQDHMRYLLNEDATVEHVRAALASLAAEAKPADVVLIYLNVNGAYDPADPDHKYLLAYDSDPEDMAGTAVSVSDLPALVASEGGSRHIVVLADTCHVRGVGTDADVKTTPDNLVNLYLARAFALAGQGALEASDLHQLSQAGAQWGGAGVFTHYLIQGLSGAADSSGDGTVTAGEIFNYVQMKVSQDTMDGQLPIASEGKTADVALAGVATARR
jgi:hypothetical protein